MAGNHGRVSDFFPAHFGGPADFLAMPHIGTLARLIIKYPACQLLGIKASIAKLFCEAWRFPKTTCSSFHVHVYTIHSLITVYLYCFRVFRDMLSLGQKCFMSFRDELRPKESVFMSIMHH